MRDLYVALVHHPVLDRSGRVVTTAITNLDIHDIARASRTYGVRGYFVVTPIEAQRELCARIVSHWRTGPSVERIPERGDALSLVRLAPDLAAVRAEVAAESGSAPFLVATAARALGRPTLPFEEARGRLGEPGPPWVLLFGTGWGLAAEAISAVDALLPPLRGPADYNHLSVRTAAAIVLDRLRGLTSGPESA